MFDTIIVPVDMAHTEAAEKMISVAKKIGNDKAEIVLLNVVEIMPEYAMSYVPGDTLGQIEQDSKKMLKDLAAKHGGNLTTRMENGSPGNTIVAVAEDIGAGAIVIASHKPGLADYFIGSTAAKVVRHAKCSVFVLR